MKKSREVPWLKGLIVQTVWPLLTRLEELMAGEPARPPAASLVAPQPSASPARTTQQIQFSCNSPTSSSYVGVVDKPGPLLHGQLLYRARGGEIIKSFILSQPSTQETAVWEVEIVHGDGNRQSIGSFPEKTLQLELEAGDSYTEARTAVALTAGQCLFAHVRVGVPGGAGDALRLDGTLEIEREATI